MITCCHLNHTLLCVAATFCVLLHKTKEIGHLIDTIFIISVHWNCHYCHYYKAAVVWWCDLLSWDSSSSGEGCFFLFFFSVVVAPVCHFQCHLGSCWGLLSASSFEKPQLKLCLSSFYFFFHLYGKHPIVWLSVSCLMASSRCDWLVGEKLPSYLFIARIVSFVSANQSSCDHLINAQNEKRLDIKLDCWNDVQMLYVRS